MTLQPIPMPVRIRGRHIDQAVGFVLDHGVVVRVRYRGFAVVNRWRCDIHGASLRPQCPHALAVSYELRTHPLPEDDQ